MASPPQAVALPSMDALYGAPAIGLLLASFMSGIVALQAFMYYRNYPNDHTLLKCLVAFTCLLDLAHLVSIAHFVYYHTITHWGDVAALNNLTWSWGMILILHTLIMGVCQGFLIYRFKVISNNNWWITAVLALVSLLQLVSGIISAKRALGTGITLISAASPQAKVEGSVWLFSGAVGDALIALSLTYYLRKRTESGMSNAIVDRLILYIGSTGAFTSVVAFGSIALYLAQPHTLIQLALNFPLGRIYTNSLLSSLNMRQALRQSAKMFSDRGYTVSFQRTTHSDYEAGRVQPKQAEQIQMNAMNFKTANIS